jgi:hypothetical protein
MDQEVNRGLLLAWVGVKSFLLHTRCALLNTVCDALHAESDVCIPTESKRAYALQVDTHYTQQVTVTRTRCK